jgi:hypothetical protein
VHSALEERTVKQQKGPRCALACIDAEGEPRYLANPLRKGQSGICPTCRANLAYWERQPPSRRILRTNRVRLYVRRMEQLS